MNDWFEWNGVRCTDYGIYVTEQPPPTIPEERVTFTNIPGRSGALTTLEGDYIYEDMVLTATCVVSDPERIPEIAGWLRGSGTVTFANRDGGFYYARVTNQIPFDKILRGNPHRTFAVNFRCKPFFYAKNPEAISLTTSGTFITNPGTVPAEPIITVYGSGEITLMVGSTIQGLADGYYGGLCIYETPYNFGSSTYSSAYMRMSGTDTSYKPYIECVYGGSTAVG